MLVTGGQDSGGNTKHDSTELLGPGSGPWRLVGAWHGLLPRPMDSMRLATLDNTVYLFGG